MINSNTTFDYLKDFYGTLSAKFFAVYVCIVCSFVILSDTIFISVTLASASLRKYRANFLLVGFCVADFLHCTAHFLGGVAIWTGSLNNRDLCQVVGAFVVMTGTCRLGFPALIAANRYYKISDVPGQTLRWPILRKIFAEKAIIRLIFGWFCFAYLINTPLVAYHAFGEDENGFCGARKFTSLELLAVYEISILVVFVSSYTLAGVYYYRLEKCLRQHQSVDNQDSVVYTRSLMRVMKIETILPLLFESPVIFLTTGQMILPVFPMWFTRLMVAPYWLAACTTPWLTIALVRPFRRRFVELISTTKEKLHLIRVSVRSIKYNTIQYMLRLNESVHPLPSVPVTIEPG